MATPLTVKTRVEEGVGIVDLSGTLTLGPTLVNLRNSARQLVTASNLSGFIIQLEGVTQTDSSGLGELTVIYTLTSLRHCPLRLVGANSYLKKMLEVTHLDRVLPVSQDVESAKREILGVKSKHASSPE
jgi:anti-anti-sigma factor